VCTLRRIRISKSFESSEIVAIIIKIRTFKEYEVEDNIKRKFYIFLQLFSNVIFCKKRNIKNTKPIEKEKKVNLLWKQTNNIIEVLSSSKASKYNTLF